MKQKSAFLFGILILICVGLSFSQSGYIKIGDIKGDATDSSHKDWISIESLNQTMERPSSTSGATRQRAGVVLNDLVITKQLDKATPKLMEMCAKGKVIPKLEIEMVTNGRVYYKIILSNARINGISTVTVCDPGCELLDKVAIGFSKIIWEHWDGAGNKTVSSYNSQTNR
jgi:type VI secretion system Hcp family effector